MPRLIIALAILTPLLMATSVSSVGLNTQGAPDPVYCGSVKLVGANVSSSDHAYKFEGQCEAGDKIASVSVLASWKATTKRATENITVGGSGGGKIVTTMSCPSDPFVNDVSCTVLSHSNTSSHNVLSSKFPLTRGLTTMAEAAAKSPSGGQNEPPPPPKPVVQAPVIASPAEGQVVAGPFTILVKPADGAKYSDTSLLVDMQVLQGTQWTNTYQSLALKMNVPFPIGTEYLPGGKHRLKVRGYGPTNSDGTTPIVESKWREFAIFKGTLAPKGSDPAPDWSSKTLKQTPPSEQGQKVVKASPSGSPGPITLLPVKLVTSRAKGPAALEVVLSNPNPEGQPLSAAIELRLGRTVVGKANGRLHPREQRGVEVLWKLPPGVRGPVDVDVIINEQKVGVAKLSASS